MLQHCFEYLFGHISKRPALQGSAYSELIPTNFVLNCASKLQQRY